MKTHKPSGPVIPLPNKTYSIIYADPAWKYGGGVGCPENHYRTSSFTEMAAIPVQDIADQDCILFMWATYCKLEEALKLIKAWGFTYRTVAFTWVKLNKSSDSYFFGLGGWTRANPEICLLATKGHPKRLSPKVANLVISRLREHSRKPDEVRKRIVELMGDLPRIELFARHRFKGWDAWGDEV